MSVEIEHKYLVVDDSYKKQEAETHHIVQGYLSRDKGRTVRIRTVDDRAFLTIKGPNHGATRAEFEYEVPIGDAHQLLALCPKPVLDKTRHIVWYAGNKWEIDEFHGDLQGLVTAEIEMPSEDYRYEVPAFVGKDVTGDRRYYNSCLTTLAALKHDE